MNGCKTLSRILSLTLALFILAGTIGCANEGVSQPSISTSADTTEETEDLYPDDLPDKMDFGGQAIRFITYDSKTSTRSIAINEEEEDIGDIINEAVWKRNQAIEARLNVDIQIAKKTDFSKLAPEVTLFIQSGSDDYDVVVGHARFDVQLASNGYLKNLNNIYDLNFSKPYWSQMYMDEIAYKGIHYWATGDITIGFISTIYCMYVNTALWNDNYKDENIYEIVNSGSWTIDSLREYASGVYQDLNGDSKANKYDVFGFAMQAGHLLNGLAFAAGMDYSSRDEKGNISLAINTEHNIDIYNKIYSLLMESGNATLFLSNDTYDNTALEMFVGNRLMFFPTTFGTCEDGSMRAMETDYYIIPLPKFDESQEKYIVNQYDGVPLYGIPITVADRNVDGIGATLEALASMSSTMVTPVYYDMALKNKYSRDEESAAMIDLIHDSVITDFVFTWGDTIGGIYELYYNNIKRSSLESVIATRQTSWNTKLQKLIDNLEEYVDR